MVWWRQCSGGVRRGGAVGWADASAPQPSPQLGYGALPQGELPSATLQEPYDALPAALQPPPKDGRDVRGSPGPVSASYSSRLQLSHGQLHGMVPELQASHIGASRGSTECSQKRNACVV